MNEINVLIADDHRIVLDGLRALVGSAPGFRCAATAENGKEVLEKLKEQKVDIVLLDIDMPVMDGMEAASRIRRDFPEVKVITLTQHCEKAMVQRLIACGSQGYLLKNADRDELLFAIRKVMGGGQYFSEQVTQKLKEKEALSVAEGSSEELTERETEILKLLAEGLSSKQIGERLFISSRTVDTHRTNLMNKLGIHNVAGLIRFAFKHGITA